MNAKERLSPIFLRRAFTALVVFMMLAAVVVLAFVPTTVHAQNVLQNGPCGTDASATSVTCPAWAGLTTGTVLVVATMSAQDAAVQVTDTLGDVFTAVISRQISAGGDVGSFRSAVWTAVHHSNAADQITVTQFGAANTLGGWAYEVAGISPLPTTTGSGECDFYGDGPCGSVANITSSLDATGKFAVAAVYAGGAGGGFTSTCCTINDPAGGGAGGPVSLYTNTTSGFILFDYHAGGTWTEWTNAAATFGPPSVVTTTTTTTTTVTSLRNGAGLQVIGSCPATFSHLHYVPANNTEYLYVGNALGQEVVNNMTFGVWNVTTGATFNVVKVGVYVGTSPTVSVGTPLVLQNVYPFGFPTGTHNTTVTIQIHVPLTSPIGAGNAWGIGIITNSHIVLAGSALSGLVAYPSPPTGGPPPPYGLTQTVINLPPSADKLDFCASASYQGVLTSTTTSTTTTTSPTTIASSTVTTTAHNYTTTISTTLTLTTYDITSASAGLTGFVLALIVILVPTILLAVVIGGVTKSGAAAMIGALVGLAVGTSLGYYAGIVPVGFVYIAVIAMVAMILLAVRSSSSGP